jgi:D-glycero-D-manno-heptose 1,7-bisphosphate phosphatase
MVKTIILDRDGVINHLVNHDGQMTAPWSIEEFEFITGAKVAVDTFKKLGYNLVVLTNQPDVYDGKLDENDLYIMNGMIRQWLGIQNIYCAYERGSKYYKPNNALLETIINKFDVDRSSSYLIGDRFKDIVCGWKSKLQTVYLGSHYSTPDEWRHIQPDYIVNNLMEASNLLMEKQNAY